VKKRRVMTGRVTVVAALGITQTIAWASSYYMPAILGTPIAAALHLSGSVFFGCFPARCCSPP
jgi:hypothetical protein